jgi:hypothetical protein
MSEMILAILGAAFAAVAIWLTVRIVNRRERWAMWMAVGLVLLPGLYVLSFGPVCWINSRTNVGTGLVWVVYRPLFQTMLHDGPRVIQQALWSFADLGAPDNHYLAVWDNGFCWQTGPIFD